MFNELTWKDGEKRAREYMTKCGYKIVYTNFACVGVELDIVAILPKKVQIKMIKKEYAKKLGEAETKLQKINLKNTLKNLIKSATDTLIITEVKARKNGNFGMGVEAINFHKQKNIARGAEFLLETGEFRGMPVRFDAVSVDDENLTYIENAFNI